MSIEDSRNGTSPTRRTLITGATAAGLGALAATLVPQPAEAAITTPIKLVCAIQRRPDLTPREFYDYWLYKHGPFATEQVKQLGAYRYVQSHTTEAALNLTLRESRGTMPPFDGVTEVWFRSALALATALATPAGAQANNKLAEDEKNFIDLSRSSYFFTTEHVMLG
ncbi:EthD domain-containing protein [Nocardioides pelophilus]|uniref:EthD domain-containing protein n=1 Tax=Nocardioides pelophilus TaxID=2172019 RepID=UPI001600F5AE|nr:EthD domain-containing protein [Nocardioides pelophilus]